MRVIFGSSQGLHPYTDAGFGRELAWSELPLSFDHVFMAGPGEEPSLEAQLEGFGPEAVVLYGYSQRLSQSAAKWANSARVPVFMIADSELRTRRGPMMRFAKRMSVPSRLRQITRFLTVGDANEAYFRHYGVSDEKLIRLGFPIDFTRYEADLQDAQSHRRMVRERIGIPPDSVVVLTVGKLVPWKRQEDLIRALELLHDSPRVHVLIVGAGPTEMSLRKLASQIGEDRVTFSGFVQPSDLPSYYLASDIYAHCSEKEPHSLAISEATFCALPVVLSDRCGSWGPTDDVRPGLNGYVYPYGDLQTLAGRIRDLAKSPTLREDMASQSRAIAQRTQQLAHGVGLIQALRDVDLMT